MGTQLKYLSTVLKYFYLSTNPTLLKIIGTTRVLRRDHSKGMPGSGRIDSVRAVSCRVPDRTGRTGWSRNSTVALCFLCHRPPPPKSAAVLHRERTPQPLGKLTLESGCSRCWRTAAEKSRGWKQKLGTCGELVRAGRGLVSGSTAGPEQPDEGLLSKLWILSLYQRSELRLNVQ